MYNNNYHHLGKIKVSLLTSITYLISSIITEPEYPNLVTWFKSVPRWQSVCPYLLDDKDGTKTEEISLMHGGIEVQRNEMLRRFLAMSNPTWKKVLDALRSGNYDNLADNIEELQGQYSHKD